MFFCSSIVAPNTSLPLNKNSPLSIHEIASSPFFMHDLSIIIVFLSLYFVLFLSQFVILLVSLVKNKNAFASCTLLSLSAFTIPHLQSACFLSCFSFSLSSSSTRGLPLLMPFYCSLFHLFLSLCTVCLRFSQSVLIPEPLIRLTYSLSLSLCLTFFLTWYTVECVVSSVVSGASTVRPPPKEVLVER